jgi:uracil-DNA glycosylase
MNALTHIKFRDSKIEIHESWGIFFLDQTSELEHIGKLIGTNFTPSINTIFKIFKLPIENIRFVIIGQDPYPQNGIATGRSFEINEESWHYVNRSLEAILVSIYYYMTGELLDYCAVLNKINSSKWNILPPNQLFLELEKQSGCFFLNKSLTCQVGKANSHENIWRNFTNQLVKSLNSSSFRKSNLLFNSVICREQPEYFY